MSSPATLERPDVGAAVRAEAERTRARGDEIEDLLAVIAGQENRLVAQTIELVAEAIDDGLCLGPDLSARRWVSYRFGCNPGRADAIVAIAERRAELPALMAALAEGAVNLDQAAVIARRVPASHEVEAVGKAEVMRPASLRRWASLCPPLDAEGGEPPSRRSHSLSLRPAADGSDADWLLRGRLPGEVGAALDSSLRSQLERLWHDHRSGGGAHTPGDEHGASPTMIDALGALVDSARAADLLERADQAERVAVMIHVDLDAKLGQFHLGPALPDSLRRYLSCDATFRAVYEKAGVAVGVDRRSRQIPRRLRRLVEHRDRGCRVPGCARTWVHLHHVRHWEDAGPTQSWNLIGLCPHHHRLHHHGRLGIAGTNADDPDGITFTDARGLTLLDRPKPAPPDRLPEPPNGRPYQHPQWGHIPTWAMTPPATAAPTTADPLHLPAAPAEPRLDKDGYPIDYPDVIDLDEED